MFKIEWEVKEDDKNPNSMLEGFCYKGLHRNGPLDKRNHEHTGGLFYFHR